MGKACEGFCLHKLSDWTFITQQRQLWETTTDLLNHSVQLFPFHTKAQNSMACPISQRLFLNDIVGSRS